MIARPGTVYLVGAGPGDPGLITVRGLELLQHADSVLYDRLVDERLLRHARPDAEVEYVGKWPRRESNTQDEIIIYMIQRAREGRSVVRLKGGDPFVFGRGGEEAMALAEAGIPFEVVPGVTSAIAVPAYAGIPVTHRHVAASFTVVSGSEDPSKEESQIDWKALATGTGTLVVLMGWESLPRVREALLAHGMSPDTPAALIQWGTEPHQRTVEGTLADILERGRQVGLEPPVVAVFGPVVGLRQHIRWFDNRPLSGKRIVVTRSRDQASTLADLLAREGADAVELPTIQIAPLADPDKSGLLRQAARELASYQWVMFTSANGAEALWQAILKEGLDARALGGVRLAAIGSATAEALERHGVHPDVVPEEYVSEALAEALRGQIRPGDRILLPRAEEGRPLLAEALRSMGAEVTQVVAYRTLAPEESRAKASALLAEGKIDAVTFTSSSTVRNLVKLLGGDVTLLRKPAIACIGPVTAATARELGLTVHVEAKVHTIPGLVEALKGWFAADK
ncbi:MAG: uroporphyrinogen-III C-methyltransferase [Dehalococcoidia bacterium]|nr:uroporphyrinogen-III C-methyltransferase [Dehalococcoidia bacterium]